MAIAPRAFGPLPPEQTRAARQFVYPGTGPSMPRLSGRSFGEPSTPAQPFEAAPVLEFPTQEGTPLVPQPETTGAEGGGGDLSQLPGFQAATEPGGVAETPSAESEGPSAEQQAQLKRLLEPDQTTQDLRKALTGGSLALKGVGYTQKILDALTSNPALASGLTSAGFSLSGQSPESVLNPKDFSLSGESPDSVLRPGDYSLSNTEGAAPGGGLSGLGGLTVGAGAAQALLSLARLFMKDDRSNADLMASLSSIPAIIGTASTIASANPYAAAVAAAINNALATYQTFEQGTWEKEPGLALTQIAMSPISGFLGGAGNAMMDTIGEAWTGEQAWRNFAKELAFNEGQQGQGFQRIFAALPYVQSKDELARLIGEARNYVTTTTGLTPELKGTGPYALSSIPGTTGTEHGVAQPRVDWGEPTRQLQALIDAYAPLLPGAEPTGTRLETPESIMRLWTQFGERERELPNYNPQQYITPDYYLTTSGERMAAEPRVIPAGYVEPASVWGGGGIGYGQPGYQYGPVPTTSRYLAGATVPEPGQYVGETSPAWLSLLTGVPMDALTAPASAAPAGAPAEPAMAQSPQLGRLLAAVRRSRTGTPLVPEAFQDTLDPAALNRLLAQTPQLARLLQGVTRNA